jgi:hypothetical protein
MKRNIIISILVGISFVLIPFISASAIPYGSGTYGSCQYGSCGISISSNNTLNLNLTPSPTGTCSVSKDTVSVLTDDSSGYTLTLANYYTSNALINGSSTINSIGGSQASPSTLSLEKWGYRVDGVGGFGSGPTTTQTNVNYPITPLFAPTPISTATPDTIATTSSIADPAVSTNVWYGVCADTNIVSGQYSTQVVYTAITN